MKDPFGREINYMRVSITDRCNLRCRYCMPRGIETVPMSDILTYEEILEVAGAAARLGVSKFRVTGGEPLARRGAPWLVRELKRLPGVQKVTMTTNGALLARSVAELKDAGLDGVNVSLDTLNSEKFRQITGFDVLSDVLAGLDAALSAGIPAKVNAVLQEGLNDGDWEPLILLARERPLSVRFIELMPLGEGKNFTPVDNAELLSQIRRKYPTLEPDPRPHGSGPAVYFRVPGFQGGVGFISAMHSPFCGSCNRLRLTARGTLKPCLCSADAVDVKEILRGDGDNKAVAIEAAIRDAIKLKPAAHALERGAEEPRRMVEIGG